MKKTILAFAMLFCLAFTLRAPGALCSDGSEKRLVEDFYTWYITTALDQRAKSSGPFRDPIYDDAVYAYVHQGTVSAIRTYYAKNYLDANYITKSQDLWDTWLEAFVAQPAVKIDGTTSLVPVTFKWTEEAQRHLLVFVQKTKDGWRIIKIEDTIPRPADAIPQ